MARRPERRPAHGRAGDKKSMNTGGVCDNCGNPAFAHDDAGNCWTEQQCEAEQQRLDAWHATVQPAREAYQLAKKHVKAARRRGDGQQEGHLAAELETARQAYTAAILAADAAAIAGSKFDPRRNYGRLAWIDSAVSAGHMTSAVAAEVREICMRADDLVHAAELADGLDLSSPTGIAGQVSRTVRAAIHQLRRAIHGS